MSKAIRQLTRWMQSLGNSWAKEEPLEEIELTDEQRLKAMRALLGVRSRVRFTIPAELDLDVGGIVCEFTWIPTRQRYGLSFVELDENNQVRRNLHFGAEFSATGRFLELVAVTGDFQGNVIIPSKVDELYPHESAEKARLATKMADLVIFQARNGGYRVAPEHLESHLTI